ncbi:MAG: FAD-dependent oxidoreductase, partial [Thermodesulfobacteriota bacterium]
MSTVTLAINGEKVEAAAGLTIMAAANAADIYIPSLCHHPDLPPGRQAAPIETIFQGTARFDHSGDDEGRGCGLCVVEIAGQAEFQPACATLVADGLVVVTESDKIKARRQEKLAALLAGHPHACLTCAQSQGCTRTQCSSNVPENERCCPRFGHCEVQAVAEYIGIPSYTPKWKPTDKPVLEGPLFTRDYNLCIGCTRCVRACGNLRGIEALGFVRDAGGRNVVGSVAETLEDSGCKFCTACVEVCPTGALRDKKVRAGKREQDLVQCKYACPAGIDIPWYLRLIAQGRFEEAHAVIREKVPFPGVLGRICIRPCEEVCRRGEVNEPLAICALKRAAADRETGGWKRKSARKPDTGNKAAVIGAGPAGLTCAFYLRKAGHTVTVYECEAEPGGMLRYGIPEYRLPRAVLDQEIMAITEEGIEIRTGKRFGRDVTLESLRAEGCQAVFLSLGARLARRIPLAGSDREGVLGGLDLLRAVRRGEPPALSGRVVVIGGGNVAIDVALTARRLGAGRVDLACLEAREEMPAHEWECQGALTEGVIFHNSWGPKVVKGDGRVTGVDLVRCTRVFDDQGRFNPAFDESVTFSLEADYVILAVGQATEADLLAGVPGLSQERGLIVVKEDQATSLEGVWAGGDITILPGSVIGAVVAGRRAAAAMDKALGGDGAIEETLFERPAPEQNLGREEGFAGRRRMVAPCVPPEARETFEEIELGFEGDQALAEAGRCLQCDLRLTLSGVMWPPEKMHPFTAENVTEAPETEGVYILYDAAKKTLAIKGAMNLRQVLEEALAITPQAA